MNKCFFLIIILMMLSSAGYAQLGLGASAGMLNPGFGKSDISQSKFDSGWGYELFVRHNLAQLSDSLILKTRWSYRHYKTTIELPNVLEIWFKFTYLTIDLFVDILRSKPFVIYSGVGGSLVSVRAQKDFLNVTKSEFMPEILIGIEYYLSQNYNLFFESSFQFGSISDIEGQSIPMHGIRIVIGATMFLISE